MVLELSMGLLNGFRRIGATLLLLVFGLLIFAAPDISAELNREDHFTLLERLGNEAALEVLDQILPAPGMTIHLVPEVSHPANWLFERIIAIQLRERGCEVICSIDPGTPSVAQPAQPAAATTPDPNGNTNSEPYTGGDADEPVNGTEDDDSVSGGDSESEEEPQEETLGPLKKKLAEEAAAAAAAAATAAAAAAGGVSSSDYALSLPTEGDVLVYRLVDFGITYPWAKRTWVIGPVKYGRIASAKVRVTQYQEPGHRFIRDGHSDRVLLDDFPGWAKPYLEGNSFPFAITATTPPSIRRIVEPAIVGVLVAGLVYLFYENQK
jgi:hypothetical protein